MGLQIDAVKSLVWDNISNQMQVKTKVSVSIVTNRGTILAEEGPLYCNNGQEVFEATMMLRNRIVTNLPGMAADPDTVI